MNEFKKGDRVKVYNQKTNGEEFLEGIAIVKKKTDYEGTFYHVCFESDGYKCVRNLNKAEIVK